MEIQVQVQSRIHNSILNISSTETSLSDNTILVVVTDGNGDNKVEISFRDNKFKTPNDVILFTKSVIKPNTYRAFWNKVAKKYQDLAAEIFTEIVNYYVDLDIKVEDSTGQNVVDFFNKNKRSISYGANKTPKLNTLLQRIVDVLA